MAIELQLPPGKTTTIQLLTRVVGSDTPGAAVGSPIPGVLDGTNKSLYRYTLGAYATGDYWGQLSGVSNPNGPSFPIRNGLAYIGFSWAVVDAIAPVAPTAPPALAGLCNVVVAVTFNGAPVAGAKVSCYLEEKNNTVISGYLASREVGEGVTDAAGYCVLTLIQQGQFSRGGTYVLKAYDENGKILQDRRVTVPNVTSCNADVLVDVL